ncbi:hypothetical protein LPJ38_30800 [Bradyrhizobium daqingense]|uniref:Invasion protein IalB n=1 Tax=Bradyrhizobium daqingense TaxID=993502 RepID=A0A562LPW0_9BRAD|nr:hypothetical protein [Bradyrhizobium daqingense]TWI09655.1 hypothetical protein IQ17_00732 [Bradyrhizobium daqingense]UFS87982.1 hypothetical protein LPJ38_30800 [Bradyrhizobium daqingense]
MRFYARSLLLLAALVLVAGSAFAQSTPAPQSAAPRPPVSVKGWRYELRPNDVHMFLCDRPGCGAQTRVSYRLYAPGNSMTLEQFREEQTQIAKVLEQRTPGQKISILAIDGDSGTSVPCMFKAAAAYGEAGRHEGISGQRLVFGRTGAASVISSAATEKASSDNFAQFAVAVMLLLAPASR